MADIFEKTLYLGLGLFSMTKERAEAIIDELVEKGKVSKDDSAKAVRSLLDRAEKEKDQFEQKVQESIDTSLKKLHLATVDDIDQINKKLDKIIKAQSQKSE